jgi:hypothetical protein|tara:strand:+ start:121 stop:801 length:681 start_codon:yes stop_codon:yes gene_type:complete
MALTNYKLIRGAVSAELCEFLSNYLSLKKEVYKTMAKEDYMSLAVDTGTFDDKQVPGAYSIYGDPVFDVLLSKVLPIMCKETSMELIPAYSYVRSYSKGQELKKHTDRTSCTVSTTLNIGGDPWPIYFLLNEGWYLNKKNNFKGIKEKKVRVDLKPGDMVIYQGKRIPHWRDAFKGRYCNQVFLHYNDKEKRDRLYDDRPHLGLSANFKLARQFKLALKDQQIIYL